MQYVGLYVNSIIKIYIQKLMCIRKSCKMENFIDMYTFIVTFLE